MVIGRDDSAPSGCGVPASETAGRSGAASLDLDAYFAVGCTADHFANPFAALAA